MVDRIAIVEDERLVRELVAVNLRHAGYDIVAAENFEEGKQLLAKQDFQLAILDVMLPGGDGFALTRFARDQGISAPILMLTARSDTTSKVRGLDAGADDYLPKPFDVNELLARVRALLRRASGRPASAPPRLGFAAYWVRFDTGQALTNEGEVSLSDKELRLMEVFAANENRALTRTDLLEEVWGMDQFPTDRTVDNFILRLRKLFEPDPENPVHIVTLRGRGYLFGARRDGRDFSERAVSAPAVRVTPIGAAEVDAARDYFVDLHTRLSDAWKSLDPSSDQLRDEWQRPAGDVLAGSGRLSLIENGATFDRAGVAFSDVSGAKLPAAASDRHTELAGQPFRAMGTSCVVHPLNPYAPTSHANVRLFTARGGEMWWFGGGFDLTPVYPFEQDARDWHEAARAACAPAGPRAYPLLKEACDRYFYLPHRGETRGIGGLFADDLNDIHPEIGGGFEHCFALIRRIGDAYLETYVHIVRRRTATPFGGREQDFQRLRRGRYVEFNLAFDRGTRFGLQSSARTESLLMSLPPRAEWRYDHRPAPGSPEARLAEYLKPRDWLGTP